MNQRRKEKVLGWRWKSDLIDKKNVRKEIREVREGLGRKNMLSRAESVRNDFQPSFMVEVSPEVRGKEKEQSKRVDKNSKRKLKSQQNIRISFR